MMRRNLRLYLGLALLGFAAILSYEAVRGLHAAYELWTAGLRTEATVAMILTDPGANTYRPVVAFRDRTGERREAVLVPESNPPRHTVGQKVPVIYPEGRPEGARQATARDIWMTPALLGATFLAFLAAGAGLLVGGAIARRRMDWLQANGIPVRARVTAIDGSAAGPWRIRAEWNDPSSGRVHVFRSQRFYANPASRIEPGEGITVVVSPRDRSRYWMDTTTIWGS